MCRPNDTLPALLTFDYNYCPFLQFLYRSRRNPLTCTIGNHNTIINRYSDWHSITCLLILQRACNNVGIFLVRVWSDPSHCHLQSSFQKRFDKLWRFLLPFYKMVVMPGSTSIFLLLWYSMCFPIARRFFKQVIVVHARTSHQQKTRLAFGSRFCLLLAYFLALWWCQLLIALGPSTKVKRQSLHLYMPKVDCTRITVDEGESRVHRI